MTLISRTNQSTETPRENWPATFTAPLTSRAIQPPEAPRWIGPAALTVTLAIAGVCWVPAIRQMSGMELGTATRLGSLGSFIGLWVVMMAAMMLPGAAPTAARRARATGQVRAVPLFIGSYLAVWMLFGLAVYVLYRPHGSMVAGAVTIAAGIYELTPLKQHYRSQCRGGVGSGFEFGRYCVGSSIGLMLILVAVSLMSVGWMAAIAVIVLGQKLIPRRTALDISLALAIIALGIVIIIEPSAIPGLMPTM